MRRLIRSLFALAALCLALTAGLAKGQGANYVVGVEDLDYFPIYAMRDKEYVGAARDILDAFAKYAGIRFTYVPMPITRLTSELVNASVDFKFPDNAYWLADLRKGKTIAYSQAVIAYIDGVMVLPEKKGRPLAQFSTLGTVTGFTPFAWQSTLKEGRVRLIENPQMRALQKQVLAGRIDGAYASVAVANHLLEKDLKQPGALVFDASLPHTRSDYYLSSAKHPELIKRFDTWLKANAARVSAIKNKHGAEAGVN
ncbi:hypothetical protein BURK2_00820 [Burkholderiales bacterium]|nr:MAG: amino acid ABC transporter substrate-binding protein [Burkholderiales bacterium]CAG0962582.1 hypothetical protein BURK2_00820 [Burkholderiales bacterium]